MSETLTQALATTARPSLEFEALYRTSVADVYAYVASLVGDAATAEDITAAAFERAYRKRRTYDPRRGTPRQWLFVIARNAGLDELRRRKRAATLTPDAGLRVASTASVHANHSTAQDAPPNQDDASIGGPSDDATFQTAERVDSVRDAIAALPSRERDLIALKFYAGLSNAELATTLGITESNAGTRLHRALGSLRKACS